MVAIRSPEIIAAFETKAILGEGPVWSDADSALWWVDPRRPSINRLDPQSGNNRCWEMPDWVGSIAPARSGLLCATRTGFARFHPTSGEITGIIDVLDDPDLRMNDGKCDPQGRFWVGSLDSTRAAPNGRLFCLDRTLTVNEQPFGYTVYNGSAWNLDGTVMYTADSWRRQIYRHVFDGESGQIAAPECFAVIDTAAGVPDGAAIDAEDHLWSVNFDGWRISRYTPSGRVERVVHLPVQRPTSCAFGGEKLDTLFVTSARVRLSDRELSEQPLAGAIFALDVGVFGHATSHFAG